MQVIVILHDENLPQGLWKLEKVKVVMYDRDGEIRAATVRLPTGNGVLCRPVQLLYPLEIRDDSNDGDSSDSLEGPIQNNRQACDSEGVSQSVAHPGEQDLVSGEARANNCPEIVDTSCRRSQRTATLEARDRLKALSIQDSEMNTVNPES